MYLVETSIQATQKFSNNEMTVLLSQWSVHLLNHSKPENIIFSRKNILE